MTTAKYAPSSSDHPCVTIVVPAPTAMMSSTPPATRAHSHTYSHRCVRGGDCCALGAAAMPFSRDCSCAIRMPRQLATIEMPVRMYTMVNALLTSVLGTKSPKPTVVNVVTAK